MDKIAAYGEVLSQHELWEVDYLLKTASAEEIFLTEQLTKVAAYGTAEELLELIAIADELGFDKEAGIFARALSGLGKGVSAVGKRLGSKSLTMGGARLSGRGALSARSSYDSAANAFRRAPVRGGGGLGAVQRAQKARAVAQDAAQSALANRAAAQNMTGIRANLAEGLGSLRQRASSGISSAAQKARSAADNSRLLDYFARNPNRGSGSRMIVRGGGGVTPGFVRNNPADLSVPLNLRPAFG